VSRGGSARNARRAAIDTRMDLGTSSHTSCRERAIYGFGKTWASAMVSETSMRWTALTPTPCLTAIFCMPITPALRSAVQRLTVEELDAAVIGFERAERDAALTQPKQVPAPVCLAQLIRRTAVVRGKTTDRVDVDGPRRRRQPGRLHVSDHP